MCRCANGVICLYWDVPLRVGLCAAIFVRASQKISAAIPHAGVVVRMIRRTRKRMLYTPMFIFQLIKKVVVLNGISTHL
jgi:hypothetical protein